MVSTVTDHEAKIVSQRIAVFFGRRRWQPSEQREEVERVEGRRCRAKSRSSSDQQQENCPGHHKPRLNSYSQKFLSFIVFRNKLDW
jgi:hypothetical protein